jgi:hypothetical protein
MPMPSWLAGVTGVSFVLGFAHSTAVTVAEAAFLLFLIAGVWIAVAWLIQGDNWQRFRMIVAGVLIAVAGVLLIVAAHWGHLFS